MKLKDLFKNVSYKQIFNIIYKEYYKDKNHTKDDIVNFDLAYRKAYEDLSAQCLFKKPTTLPLFYRMPKLMIINSLMSA